MSKMDRPLPEPDDATQAYWDAARAHELHMQRCAECGSLRFPPRPMCPRCQSLRSEWTRVSGRGEICSWVVCHPPVLPAFQDRAPYAVVLVELEEDSGLRLVGNLLDDSQAAIEIGTPVEVVFEDVTPELTLPQWRRVPGGEG